MHRELLLQNLQKALANVTLPARPLFFSKPAQYTNDEGTCHFLALDLDKEESCDAGLKEIVSAVDSVVGKFGLPAYYDPPRFHISLAWRLDEWHVDEVGSFLSPIKVVVREIFIKCGNKIQKLR